MKENSTYKSIFKSASLFGGVKLFQIFASILRSKIVAIYLGTSGMGISSILVSSTTMLQSVSELGLNFSSVKEISESFENKDSSIYKRKISIFLRLVTVASILGMMLMVIFSSLLSNIAFGNNEYTWAFILLSLLILFNTLSGGMQSILQGTRNLKAIAKATVLGTALSILLTLPIYVYFGKNGIVPALIISSLILLILNLFFSKKYLFFNKSIKFNDVRLEGRAMLQLGFTMVFVNLLSSIVPFLINSFIKNKGSLSDVGLYQAGLSLTTQYISLVFAAMTVDYFPRVSSISDNNQKIKELANQQGEIMLLIIIPLLSVLIITAPILIKILLTNEFSIIVNFVRLMSIGLFFQAANYSMGLISFSKGDKRTFIILSVIGNISWLLFSIFGYKFYKLSGVGFFYIIHSIFCFLLVYLTIATRYQFSMSFSFIKLLTTGFFSLLIAYLTSVRYTGYFGYAFNFALLLIIFFYSIFHLNKKIEIFKYIMDLKDNFIIKKNINKI